MQPRLEFRIPIAPTRSFYHRAHFFCAALQRLGSGHADALVRIAVGDRAVMDQVERENSWSTQYNVEWHRVPEELSSAHGYYGTSDFRYLLPEADADLVILADADTALVRPLADDFRWMLDDVPCIAGHMAHGPPPAKFAGAPAPAGRELWPRLFEEFAIPFPQELYRYSKDITGRFSPAPAYYNLGFVVLNRAALRIFRERIAAVRARLNEIIESEMRCQIAATLIAYQSALKRRNLPATFNAANDDAYLRHNNVRADQIKVIHYLRRDELDRECFLDEQHRSHFLEATFRNPVNRLLQQAGREIFNSALEFAH